MDDAAVLRNGPRDRVLGLGAIRPVMLFHYLLAYRGGRIAGCFRVQMRVADRPIQVDQQTAYRGRYQRRPQRRRQLLRHDQRTGIIAAVGIQQCLMRVKQILIRRGNPLSTMFAGDQEGVDHNSAEATIAVQAVD